jgi:predicted tellurium resistance membrane protein TerC
MSSVGEIAISLLSLTVLEIILGIDNLIFISILANQAPKEKRILTMKLGLSVAWITRLLLLAGASWITGLTQTLFTIGSHPITIRNIFMLLGGLFLFIKSIQEIHKKFADEEQTEVATKKSQLLSILLQIALIDIVFSIDSILTAIGLTNHYWIMATAITIAIIIMIFASKPINELITKYPTIKMLALSFLLLVGIVLIADGMGQEISKGYLYFAICFSLFVEALNIKLSKKKKVTKK